MRVGLQVVCKSNICLANRDVVCRHRRELELRYFRDVDGREVDFVVVERREPILLVEAKLTATSASPALRYLKQRFPSADAWQIQLRGDRDSVTDDRIRLASAQRFLGTLL